MCLRPCPAPFSGVPSYVWVPIQWNQGDGPGEQHSGDGEFQCPTLASGRPAARAISRDWDIWVVISWREKGKGWKRRGVEGKEGGEGKRRERKRKQDKGGRKRRGGERRVGEERGREGKRGEGRGREESLPQPPTLPATPFLGQRHESAGPNTADISHH